VRVWFLVPVHGRLALTRVCLRQLARTCLAAAEYGVEATAVVVGDDASLDVAADLGFATVRRDNAFLGRKFNDGFQKACDPEFNSEPADFVIPCGSDDWIDPVILSRLPRDDEVGVFRQLAVVDETRTRLSRLRVGYKGGCGVRILSRRLLAAAGYRPAAEDRYRAVDTSALEGLKYASRGQFPRTVDLDVHPLQIVDWKSSGEQLNSYSMLTGFRRGPEVEDPFEALSGVYPVAALDEMREVGCGEFSAVA
jgi:hypothetical protein